MSVRYSAIIVVPILWALFALAAVAAFLIGVPAAIAGHFLGRPDWVDWTERNVRAADKAAAAFLGWSGENTVSKECGKDRCAFCRVLCAILSALLERDHCLKEGAGKGPGDPPSAGV